MVPASQLAVFDHATKTVHPLADAKHHLISAKIVLSGQKSKAKERERQNCATRKSAQRERGNRSESIEMYTP